jgi:hypothetical protein
VHQPGESGLGLFHVVNEDIIGIHGPNGGQVAKVMTQLTASVRRGEIAQVDGQRNVVFWIENMQFCHNRAQR